MADACSGAPLAPSKHDRRRPPGQRPQEQLTRWMSGAAPCARPAVCNGATSLPPAKLLAPLAAACCTGGGRSGALPPYTCFLGLALGPRG
jgi:hypothetical protein